MPTRPAAPERPKRARGPLVLAALVAGCSVCLLPGLLAGSVLGGALGGAVAWLSGAAAWIAGGAGLLLAVGVFAFLRARAGRGDASGSCGDGGCSCAAEAGGPSAA